MAKKGASFVEESSWNSHSNVDLALIWCSKLAPFDLNLIWMHRFKGLEMEAMIKIDFGSI